MIIIEMSFIIAMEIIMMSFIIVMVIMMTSFILILHSKTGSAVRDSLACSPCFF